MHQPVSSFCKGQIVLIFFIWIYQVITTWIIFLSYNVYKTIKLQVQSLFLFYTFWVDMRKVLQSGDKNNSVWYCWSQLFQTNVFQADKYSLPRSLYITGEGGKERERQKQEQQFRDHLEKLFALKSVGL